MAKRDEEEYEERALEGSAPLGLWRPAKDGQPGWGVLIDVAPDGRADEESRVLSIVAHPCRQVDSRLVAEVGQQTGWPLEFDRGQGRLCGSVRLSEELTAERLGRIETVVRAHAKHLECRWRRRCRQRDREPWRKRDWSELEADELVPYQDAFPYDWDLLMEREGRQYWAQDMYCLNPQCPCGEATVDWHELVPGRADARELGRTRVKIDDGSRRVQSPNGLARALTEQLLATENLRRQLVQRFEQMRHISPKISALARPPQRRGHRRVGRNEPCPCGSGRKYKRCCLDTDRKAQSP